MSFIKCEYCEQQAFKTNGNAEAVCYNRANTGKCESTQDFDYKEGRFKAKKPGNQVCPHGKKVKNCKKCNR